MILLGIDPGIADMGYGVISKDKGKETCLAYGSVKTPAGMDFPKRLALLAAELEKLLVQWRPAAAGIEKLYFQKNVKTAISVAEARGVIRLCIERAGVPCREFNPSDVKIAVCGQGNAPKDQVQRMVKTLLRLDKIPKPDDAADALALAITLANHRR